MSLAASPPCLPSNQGDDDFLGSIGAVFNFGPSPPNTKAQSGLASAFAATRTPPFRAGTQLNAALRDPLVRQFDRDPRTVTFLEHDCCTRIPDGDVGGGLRAVVILERDARDHGIGPEFPSAPVSAARGKESIQQGKYIESGTGWLIRCFHDAGWNASLRSAEPEHQLREPLLLIAIEKEGVLRRRNRLEDRDSERTARIGYHRDIGFTTRNGGGLAGHVNAFQALAP